MEIQPDIATPSQICFIDPFLTREYAKRNERVIGMDGKFTRSILPSLQNTNLPFVFMGWLRGAFDQLSHCNAKTN